MKLHLQPIWEKSQKTLEINLTILNNYDLIFATLAIFKVIILPFFTYLRFPEMARSSHFWVCTDAKH